jgi:arylsulfatase A-like enzyme
MIEIMVKKEIKYSVIIVISALLLIGVAYYVREAVPNENNQNSLENIKKEYCEDCNVILITMDTTRADHFSSYGYERDTTTLIDAIAQEGVLFENNFVQMPYTPTSHWSIMSGTYPHTHGHFSPGIPVESGGPDDTDLPFIAKVFKKNGYATIALMGSKMVHSLVPGFDIVDLTPAAKKDNTSAEVTDKAVTFINDNSERKFFMWIHYWDPHDPYKPPAEYVYPDNPDEEFNKFVYMQRRYDGEIKHVDHEFGRVLDLLKELNIDKKTLIVVTADHGEAFGEHKKGDFAPNRPDELTRGHYQTVYDEELHTPLVIFNPANPHSGERFSALTQEIDIFPTILDILGIDIPEDIEGKSLKDIIDGKVEKVNDYTFSILKYVENELMEMRQGKKEAKKKTARRFNKGLRATLRTDKWKLIRFVNTDSSGVEKISYVLYDLEKGEDEDVLKQNKEVADAMIEQLELMLKAGDITNEEVELSDEEIKILKSLGYLK